MVEGKVAASRVAIAAQAAAVHAIGIVAVDSADKDANPSHTGSSVKSRPSRSPKK